MSNEIVSLAHKITTPSNAQRFSAVANSLWRNIKVNKQHPYGRLTHDPGLTYFLANFPPRVNFG